MLIHVFITTRICDIFIDDGLYVNLNKQKLEDMFDYFNCIFKICSKRYVMLCWASNHQSS
jgi:hypothetical protein